MIGRNVAACVLLACAPAAGCGQAGDAAFDIPGADAARGRALVRAAGCGACHVVPGIPGARGMVGPPLTDFSRRTYIAGRLPNEPGALVQWIVDPPAVDSLTAMPRLGLSPAQARDVAAYLYTLGAARPPGLAALLPQRLRGAR